MAVSRHGRRYNMLDFVFLRVVPPTGRVLGMVVVLLRLLMLLLMSLFVVVVANVQPLGLYYKCVDIMRCVEVLESGLSFEPDRSKLRGATRRVFGERSTYGASQSARKIQWCSQ